MAVIITSKFYQSATWKDISKIVFTSPNMTSPSVAGTRSHILPGEGNLGTWYEDTSQMFRIEDQQQTTESDFYNYRMLCKDTTNLIDAAGYIDVKQVNYDGFDTYVKESTGVEVIGYEDNTGLITDRKTRLEYTPLQENLNEIHIDSDEQFESLELTQTALCKVNELETIEEEYYRKSVIRDYGWFTEVITEIANCYITFEFTDAVKVTALSMSSLEYKIIEETRDLWAEGTNCEDLDDPTVTTTTHRYFIGNFKIQGSNDETTWTDVYTGANTTNLTKFIYLNNSSYYKYYRLSITNNTGLNTSTFNVNYYGVRALKFYTYQFSTEAGDDTVTLYEFNDLDNPKILKISNAYPQESTTPTVSTTITDQSIQGSTVITLVPGSPGHSTYYSEFSSTVDPYDYITHADCIATTVSGKGTDSAGATYAKQDKVNVVVVATTEFVDPGTEDEYLLFNATGSQNVNVDNVDWVGTANIKYTTVASGTSSPGASVYQMSGTTTREYTSTLYSRRESFRLVVDEYTTSSGIIAADEPLYVWGYNERPMDLDTQNSIVFEVTTGEAYNCRLTAWDDVTHSTVINELIQGDHVRCSAMAYCCMGDKLTPTASKDPLNLVYPPVHNRIFKGNVNIGFKHYYGDFDLVYRHQTDIYGDFLIFKPMLYGIDSSISYGIHDYLITLHYLYT